MIPDLQRVLEPSYLSGIADAPIEQIRSMRAECSDLENGASFVRRLAQGRLDLLAEETKRRADGGGGTTGGVRGTGGEGGGEGGADGGRAGGEGSARSKVCCYFARTGPVQDT